MNQPYHLATVIIVTLILYFLTWLGWKTAIISKRTYHYIWNTALLVTFVATAILGVILALQVNYKFELPGLDTYMMFHVDAGIAMAIVSVIHLVWHWGYYSKMFKPHKVKKNISMQYLAENEMDLLDRKAVLSAIFYLGLQSILVQTIYIREFLALFTGNELIIGIILVLWMLMTGFGSVVAKKTKIAAQGIRILIVFMAIIPLLSYLSMNLLRYELFIPGSEVDLFSSTWFIALFQLPFCIISGLLFPQLVAQAGHYRKADAIGSSYALETIGSVFGGLIMGFLLFHLTNNLNILIIGLFLGSSLIVIQDIKHSKKFIIGGVTIIIGLAAWMFPVERKVKSTLYINQDIQNIDNSVYGEIVQTAQFEQVNIYENQQLIFSSGKEQEIEEMIHFPLIQHTDPKHLLIISPNISQIIKELKLYPCIASVDFVETNPVLIEYQQNMIPDSTSFNVNIIQKDPVRFFRDSKKQYDIIILDAPPPSTLNYNRFYTQQFYDLVNQRLLEKGILSTSLPAGMNYMNPELINLIGTIYSTINQVFNDIVLFPATKTYVLASNERLSKQIIPLLESKNIEADYVNPYYLDVWAMQQQQDQIIQGINTTDTRNTQNHPVGFFYYIDSWFSKIGDINRILIYVLAVAIMGMLLINKNKYLISVFISGFTVSGIEFIVILLFQTTIGALYQYISVIIAAFMLGIAIGSWWPIRLKGKAVIYPLQLFIAVITGGYSLYMHVTDTYSLVFVYMALFVGTGVAVLCGMVFVNSAHIIKQDIRATASMAYSYDLFGSALGALVIPILLIPFIGFIETMVGIAIINLFIGTITAIRK